MFSFEDVKNKIKNIYSPVDDFLVTYLHKGDLGNNILVKYILKELFVYFVVAFLVFFMILYHFVASRKGYAKMFLIKMN